MALMPSRILGAPPPPPRSLKRAPSYQANGADEEDDDVDMVFTPVANGRKPIGNAHAIADLVDDAPAHLPVAGPSSEVDSADESSDDEDEEDDEWPVAHVEVRLLPHAVITRNHFVTQVSYILQDRLKWVHGDEEFAPHLWEDVPMLRDNVERIFISEIERPGPLKGDEVDYDVHVYKPWNEAGEVIQGGLDEDEEEDCPTAATITNLPSVHMEGLWENLIYEGGIKERLLRYINTSLVFADCMVDPNVISSNRLALMYGPAGTGKTSLCRALGQKLAIRYLDGKYPHGAKLIEINSHSLFSKWFSESGKLVQKVFDKVQEYLGDPECLVVVMIDEVESIAVSRATAMMGSEPSDTVRVVNAILTQLDRLKQSPNALVLATSNLVGGIDAAFVDRADIKQYIGPPPPEAIYWILKSTFTELGKRREGRDRLAPHGDRLLCWKEATPESRQAFETRKEERIWLASVELRKIAVRCHALGASGRFLRRLPKLAHVRLGRPSARLAQWMEAFAAEVEAEAEGRELIAQGEGRYEGKRQRGE
ncbi:AAA-domain-containing protein [Cutaneotrichosporon oleaginosum]|uniref:AAA-domain-containing protein n=1 Tax=Cutaneotrichosporon oleaginosum TaxID=879819 RepID=A0A0J0XR36_9TREE|nr:AAA-domain-containing protein [Cutaneotrichosporon oleaginosum]KLT43558.1 AAA-domain-containing protein [Cutaneotrichosporon oleaginosum]TXT05543.1 hypothetical protein COLE_06863 [Cutaneotrichosporon oleaginosum]